jgi:hypothetical protein
MFRDHEHCADIGKCWMSETQIASEGPCPALEAVEREVRLEEQMNADLIDWHYVRGIVAPDY